MAADLASSDIPLCSARLRRRFFQCWSPGGFVTIWGAPDRPRLPYLPVVIYPGNVGGYDALAQADRRLARPSP